MIQKRSVSYTVYENRNSGKRIFYQGVGLTGSQRSAIRFRRKTMNACRSVHFLLFGTLTYNTESLPYSSKHVSKFFMKWRKHNTRLKVPKPKVEYIWREDFGKKKGRPHYHYLASQFEDIKKIQEWWGRGFVWMSKVKGMYEVRKYLNKYMAKPAEYVDATRNKRRYGSSQGIPKLPKSEWKLAGWAGREGITEMVYVHNQNLGILDNYLSPKKSDE